MWVCIDDTLYCLIFKGCLFALLTLEFSNPNKQTASRAGFMKAIRLRKPCKAVREHEIFVAFLPILGLNYPLADTK
jgi:hypothetical protein